MYEDGKNNKSKDKFTEISKNNSNENNTYKLKYTNKNSKNGSHRERKNSHKNIEINNNIYKNDKVIINFQKQYLIFNNSISENSFKNNNFKNLIRKSLTSNVLIPNNKNNSNKFFNLISTKENSFNLIFYY